MSGAYVESIKPVWNPVIMSTVEIGTGLNPAHLKMSMERVSVCEPASFIDARSAGVRIGDLVKKYTQPTSDHVNTMKPFSARFFSRMGLTSARTWSHSS